MIDVNAGEVFADRFVNEGGGNRAVNSAAHCAKHLFVAHFFADKLDLLLAKIVHGPVAFCSANLV